jgi:hypothetical protein
MIRGAMELRDIFQTIAMSEQTFNAPAFTRLKQLRHLIATKQLDAALYWRSSVA